MAQPFNYWEGKTYTDYQANSATMQQLLEQRAAEKVIEAQKREVTGKPPVSVDEQFEMYRQRKLELQKEAQVEIQKTRAAAAEYRSPSYDAQSL